MHVLLPTVIQRLVTELSQANIPGRLFNQRLIRLLSNDFLVNKIGVSWTYQNPEHLDHSDVGCTFAFSCKCSELTPPKIIVPSCFPTQFVSWHYGIGMPLYEKGALFSFLGLNFHLSNK
jgi:hypothetical protein